MNIFFIIFFVNSNLCLYLHPDNSPIQLAADMVKLVDMPDLGSGAARRVGSSPIIRTKASHSRGFFYFIPILKYCF